MKMNDRSIVLGRARAIGCGAAVLSTLMAAAAWAEEAAAAAPVIDTGDTAWVLTSSALVLMMTLPGLALFYGGLVRAKNVLNVLMQCFISAGIVGVLWILVGYSLAFGTGNAFIGDFSKVGLAGVTLDSVTANFATPPRNIPEYVFIMFQAMFAIITPGADPRRDRRAHEVQRLGRVHHHLAAGRLLPDRAHGVGRRGLDLQGGRDRLRRRPGRAHVERLLGARRGAHARQAPRLRQGADAAAQPAALPDRRRPAVDRLVRLQRRQRAQREPARGARLPQHQHRGLDGGRRLGGRSSGCTAASRRRSAARPRRSPAWSRSRRPAATSSPMGAIAIGVGVSVDLATPPARS